MAENLVQRGAIWYARVQAPKTLVELRRQRGVTGQKDIWRSLRTKDRSVAKRLLPETLKQIYAAFDAEEASLLREGAGPRPLTKPTEHELQQAAWSFLQDELRLDELERVFRPSANELEVRFEKLQRALRENSPSSDLDLLKRPGVLELLTDSDRSAMAEERRAILADELRQHLRDNQFVLVEWAICHAASKNGWLIEKDSPEHKMFGRMLLRSWLSALGTAEKRDRGDYEEPPLVVPLHDTAAQASCSVKKTTKPKRGESLMDYFDIYLREKKSHIKSSGLRDARATMRQFVECNGIKPVTCYSRSDMANFKRLLAIAPARAEKLYPGVPLPKAAELNKRDRHPKLRGATIRNKLSTLSAFGQWLEMNVEGVDAANFTTTLPPRDDSERMEPFTDEEVRKILNALAFTGCRSERNQLEPGDHKIRDWRYWLPLVMAFTGARLNEITQLEADDLQEIDGIWVFRIHADAPGKSLKTKGSKRLIPVHPRLLELGLLELRADVVRSGQNALFHQITVDRDGRRSHHAGKWFRKFLERIGVKGEGDMGGAHRWRHTLTDALRKGGVEEYEIASLLGHKVDAARMTGHYGREIALGLQRRFDLIAKAHYPSVDFDLLK